MDEVTILIAELHSAGYSNEKIGMLLLNYGGRKRRDESTVRLWALRKSEPRKSDWDALLKLKADVFHVEHSDKNPIEVVAVKC